MYCGDGVEPIAIIKDDKGFRQLSTGSLFFLGHVAFSCWSGAGVSWFSWRVIRGHSFCHVSCELVGFSHGWVQGRDLIELVVAKSHITIFTISKNRERYKQKKGVAL